MIINLLLLLFTNCSGQQQDPIHTVIIYGNSDLGVYAANLYVGTPPVKQSVIIDTGSSITAFPCNKCKNCGKHEDAPFNVSLSSTLSEVKCQTQYGNTKCPRCDGDKCLFSISYAEGSSISGQFLIDKVLFGDKFYEDYLKQENVDFVIEQQIPSIFGCTLSETNQFYSQYPDGIMGLSPKTNTTFAFPNIVDDIYKKEASQDLQNVFTICIGRINGYMVAGGYDLSRHQPNSIYHKEPYDDSGDMYNVKVNKIIFNGVYTILQGHEINFNNGVGIDSGSTLFYADYKIVNKFRQYFNMTNESKYLEIGDMPCYYYNSSLYDFKTFASLMPEYYFEFDRFNYTWSPIDYLTKDLDQPDYYCLPILSYSGRNSIILGQAWMRNWDIAFNKSDQTIRFVKNLCSDKKVHHDYTGEEIIKLEQGLNYTNKTRAQPKQQEQTFYEQYQFVIKIGGMLLIVLIVFIIYMIYRKRRMANMGKKQRLDVEDLEVVQANKV